MFNQRWSVAQTDLSLQNIMSQYSYPQYAHYSKVAERCKKCYKTITDNHFLKEQICSSVYCYRCICQIYQPHYLCNEPGIIIELYCGHFVDRQAIEDIVKKACVNCGNQYDSQKDVEMKDGVKLCRQCFDYDSNKYKDFLMQCMSCNRIIRSLSFLANTEIILCRECATAQSNIQQSFIKEEFPYNPKKSNNQPAKPAKKKQEPEEPDEEISIVSRFSACQGPDNENKNHNGEQKLKKIKITSKHSVEVRVENFKISIQPDKTTRERCTICGCWISDESMILREKDAKECQICFMQNFDPRDIGSNKLFARSSAEGDRNKYTSAPKNKGLQIPGSSTRTMKKSYMFESAASSSIQPSSLFDRHLKTSILSKGKQVKQPWQQPLVDDEKKCEICKANKYMIIRSDMKKVCSACYSKKAK